MKRFKPAHGAVLSVSDVYALKSVLDSHQKRRIAGEAIRTLADKSAADIEPGQLATVRKYQEGAGKKAREGEIEIDDNPAVVMSEEGGAYVQAWLRVTEEDAA